MVFFKFKEKVLYREMSSGSNYFNPSYYVNTLHSQPQNASASTQYYTTASTSGSGSNGINQNQEQNNFRYLYELFDHYANSWTPNIDVIENNDYIIVNVSLPGVKKRDIHISFCNNIITVRGQKIRNTEETRCVHRHTEFVYGTFYRDIVIPCNITLRESIAISLKKGVLTININKNIENRNRINFSHRNIENNSGSEDDDDDNEDEDYEDDEDQNNRQNCAEA